MKRIVMSLALISLAFLLCSFSFGDFEPIEAAELSGFFGPHSDEEGPGHEWFGQTFMRIHVPQALMPIPVEEGDTERIADLLEKTGRPAKNLYMYTDKIVFEWKSRASWRETARMTFYINNVLERQLREEVAPGDEYYLFVSFGEYSTFNMEGFGIVNEFLTPAAMEDLGLL